MNFTAKKTVARSVRQAILDPSAAIALIDELTGRHRPQVTRIRGSQQDVVHIEQVEFGKEFLVPDSVDGRTYDTDMETTTFGGLIDGQRFYHPASNRWAIRAGGRYRLLPVGDWPFGQPVGGVFEMMPDDPARRLVIREIF